MGMNEVGIRICKTCNKSLCQTIITYGNKVFIQWEVCHDCAMNSGTTGIKEGTGSSGPR